MPFLKIGLGLVAHPAARTAAGLCLIVMSLLDPSTNDVFKAAAGVLLCERPS